MIKDDRKELNARFRHAWATLEEKGTIVKNDRSGKGVGDVAERVLGNKAYGHIIRAYLSPSSKRVIDYSQAKNFCTFFQISENWLFNGLGEMFLTGTSQTDKVGVPKMPFMPYTGGKNKILWTSVEAFAGDSFAAEGKEDNDYFSVPGIAGSDLVAFTIKGRSMEPIINDRDIVVCRRIESVNDIKENEIYAVRSDGKVNVKYVQKLQPKGIITGLKLISANYFDHDPFEIEVNETTALFKVISRISNM
jgi:phage repressor protein C with HTH and peptisase S24 domain